MNNITVEVIVGVGVNMLGKLYIFINEFSGKILSTLCFDLYIKH